MICLIFQSFDSQTLLMLSNSKTIRHLNLYIIQNLDLNVVESAKEPEKSNNNNKKKVEQHQASQQSTTTTTEPTTTATMTTTIEPTPESIGDLVGTDSEEDEATNESTGSYRINW